MGNFRHLELCRRQEPCPFREGCRNVHATQGEDHGINRCVKTNNYIYRGAAEGSRISKGRSSKENTQGIPGEKRPKECLAKKKEPETPPSSGFKSDPVALVLKLLERGDRR